ncbi:MAG TPA: hypothetical protein VFR24_27635 [Candidatus Angelobacter sp.]|nr:hypothetical protein [Candidatus Angelobacter sp.]
MSNIQAKIEQAINGRIDAMINAAIDKALGGGSTIMPKVQPTHSVSNGSNGLVQDLVDVARRAARYSREGHSFSKQERNVIRRVIKAAKAGHNIVTSQNDVWSRNGH